MGWALPAAIGASFNDREVICIAGDGSLMMNIQELATLKNSNRNIKLIIVDNAGYAMVRQTEMQWLNGTHVGTDVKSSDLSFPNFSSLLDSFQINSIEIDKNNFINSEEIINSGLYDGFILKVDPVYGVYPQAKFGLPIEDSEPFLDRTLFTEVTSINDSY
jgi:acetolactate synthase-1/2/3 large subunit